MSQKKLFVLDTNVLMHDPSALFQFAEHDIALSIVVLEELDAHKKGKTDVARNVRSVSRTLDRLLADATPDTILRDGVPLVPGEENGHKVAPTGRLFAQNIREPVSDCGLEEGVKDNSILCYVLYLVKKRPNRSVVLVSKDVNMRIKAKMLGLAVQDYGSDRVVQDVDLLQTGWAQLPATFWGEHVREVDAWEDEGRTFYRITGPLVSGWYPGQFLWIAGDDAYEFVVRTIESDNAAVVEQIADFCHDRQNVWGITARNREQNFALNLLMDSDIDFVTLLGPAGTGKTLLALAAGLSQVLDHNLYTSIIMTRVTVPVGEDIGFLPGTEEEKMTPWMGALMDNMEVLTQHEGGDWGRAATNDLLRQRVEVRSLNFMRGRTFHKKYVVLDEAQNLTAKQMKTLISRAGPGTKIVCLGNVAQIDTPYLTETTSGLTYVVERFKDWQHAGHVTLLKGERSRLADFANEEL